jgi:hypothetical protein
MSDAQRRVDLLFIVPDARRDTWKQAVKLTLWSIESNKTFEVMSADTFVSLYENMPVEEMNKALEARCVAFANSGDISKREWKRFRPLREKIHSYWQAEKLRKEQSHE